MTRYQALAIHGSHSVAFGMALLASLGACLFLIARGEDWVSVVGWSAIMVATSALIAGTYTDLMSMRIPDRVSALPLLAVILWWAFEGVAVFHGYDLDYTAGAFWWLGTGEVTSIVPSFDKVLPVAWITMDLIAAILIFFPLYFSFALGFGFGGGDVKLMTSLCLFFGWPLAFDFVFLTYAIGGLIAVGVVLIRSMAKALVYSGNVDPRIKYISGIRSFPFAPAIAVAGIVCAVAKTRGIL